MIKKTFKSIGERVARINRNPRLNTDPAVEKSVRQLNERGYVILDHLVGSPALSQLKNRLDVKIEREFDMEFPCLAQSKIEEKRDQDLILSNFLASPTELSARGLTFSRDDIDSYDQMIACFKPSTLKVKMPIDFAFFNFWLDPIVMAIVSNYMGFYPHLTEAYIRRNFPCTYPVMNHNWHRDTNHDKHLLKAFIFFTDCDIDTGAHHYIAGSVNDRRCRESKYYTDEEIDIIWPAGSEKRMVSNVPAGTIIVEDTRGLHKAGIPKKDYRDLGFAVFLPPNIFGNSRSFYQIDKATINSLNEEQKMFIPDANVMSI